MRQGMYQRFATGLVKAHTGRQQKARDQSSRFKMCACAVENYVLMVSCTQVPIFHAGGDDFHRIMALLQIAA